MWHRRVQSMMQQRVGCARHMHANAAAAATIASPLRAAAASQLVQPAHVLTQQSIRHASSLSAPAAATASHSASAASSRLLRPGATGLLLQRHQAGLHLSSAAASLSSSSSSAAAGSASGDSSTVSSPASSTTPPSSSSASPASRLITNLSPSASSSSSSSSPTAGSPSPSGLVTSAAGLTDPPDWGERDPRMLDCILVRHGESEGNIAYNRSWEGDHSLYTGAFLKRHSSLWRLTDRGREQAKTAGEWLRAHTRSLSDISDTSQSGTHSSIYRYYVSEYIRAMETAALMELPNAKWFVEGTFDIMSQKERVVRFSEETRRRDRDSLFYAPPGGESLVHVLSRVDGVLTNFNRQCANRRCIVVCHGEVMWAFRLRFERLSQLTYREMEAASSPYERIHNCQILWYSRRNPYTGEISKFFQWKRSVCPWDLKRSHNEWEEIVRVEHTNESLAAHVSRVKRIYGHEKSYRASTMPPEQAALLAAQGAAPGGQLNRAYNTQPPRPPTPPVSDPNIAAEIHSLKTDLPVMAAAAAKHTDDPSLLVPPPPAALSSHGGGTPGANSGLAFDPATEDAHLPLGGVPTKDVNMEPTAAAAASVASVSAAAAADVASSSSASSASGFPVVSPSPPAWTPAPGWPFLSAHPRVLVLTKTPRYEHEKNQSGLRGQDLHAELSKLGFVSDRLVQSYVRHIEGLAQLTLALQQNSMKVVVKHVDSATHADLEGIDLILSAGGDGTMLKAAALLGYQTHPSSTTTNSHATVSAPASNAPPHTDNSVDEEHASPVASVSSPAAAAPVPSTIAASVAAVATSPSSSSASDRPYIPIPLIGVNTDPQHSSGVLCAFSIEGPHTAVRVIEHLRRSHFVWVEKSRIEIVLVDKAGIAKSVGQYAYNDVVVAERDPGRPIVYELTVDDHPAEIQRSSGVLVCTGTGSTAWMANAAGLHPDQVSAVLKDVGHKHSMADARQIADRINMDLVFESNSPEVEYFVREPLLPLSSAASVGRVGYQHRHGWAGRVAVRSLGWDAVISIDGINLVQLPKGTTAILHIGKKPGANLMVLSLAGTGGEPFSRQ